MASAYFQQMMAVLAGGGVVGYDIILLAGQSNMAGRGTYSAGIDTTDPRVFQWDGYSASPTYQTIIPAQDRLKHPELGAIQPGVTLVGPGMFFGKAYAARTGRRVLLVPVAWGGTSVVAGTVTWSPYTGNNRDYLNALAQANAAVAAAQAAYPDSRFAGVLWIHGEGDGANSVSQAAYTAAMLDVIAGMRSGITGASASWFIVGQMMPEAIATQGGTYADIDAAHTALGTSVAKCIKVSIGTGYNSGDNLHYNAAGARLMGSTMDANVPAAEAAAGDAAAGQVTGLSSTGSTAASVSLSWTAPATGVVRDYEVQYALAGSGSWSVFGDGVGTGTTATVSGLNPSTSYDFRVRARNYGASPVGEWSNTITAATTASELTDAFVRLTAITGSLMTETGSAGTGWTYGSATGSTLANDHAGVSNLKMPAGVDGSLRVALPASANNGNNWILGLLTSQADPVYSAGASGYKWGVINHSGGTYRVIVDGAATAVVGNGTSTAVQGGDIVRLARSGGTIVAQVARAASPTTWITVHTFAASSNADLWAAISVVNPTGLTRTLGGPLIGNGWA